MINKETYQKLNNIIEILDISIRHGNFSDDVISDLKDGIKSIKETIIYITNINKLITNEYNEENFKKKLNSQLYDIDDLYDKEI